MADREHAVNRPVDELRPGETAYYLGISTTTLKRWTDRGQIPAVTERSHAGHRRYSRAMVLAVIEAGLRPDGRYKLIMTQAEAAAQQEIGGDVSWQLWLNEQKASFAKIG